MRGVINLNTHTQNNNNEKYSIDSEVVNKTAKTNLVQIVSGHVSGETFFAHAY